VESEVKRKTGFDAGTCRTNFGKAAVERMPGSDRLAGRAAGADQLAVWAWAPPVDTSEMAIEQPSVQFVANCPRDRLAGSHLRRNALWLLAKNLASTFGWSR
jgi:hypothetical protein